MMQIEDIKSLGRICAVGSVSRALVSELVSAIEDGRQADERYLREVLAVFWRWDFGEELEGIRPD